MFYTNLKENDKIKKKLIFPIFLVLLLFPLLSALTITDTTFFASETNYTIFVDSITLDNVTVTNTSITFYNLTSIGSNFTNTNATFDAVATFIGLDVGLTILNVNTSVNLFSSVLGSQNFNATFTPGQTIRTIITPDSDALIACNTMIIQFGGFVVFIGLLGTIILLGGIIFTLATAFTGSGTADGVGKLFAGLLVVVTIGILIIVALVIYSNLCGLF